MILLYHKIAPDVPSIWWVSVDAFDRQMAELQAYDVVHLDDYDATNSRHAVITFDGVYENVYRYALPILKKWGYPFELFVIGAHIGGDNSFDSIEPLTKFASLDQLEEMSRNGGHVQWHTATHQRLDGLAEAELQRELTVPSQISSRIGQPSFRWLAYPHGDHSEQTVAAVKDRFDGALSCEAGNDLDRYQLNRVTVLEDTRLTHSSVAVIIPNYNYRNFVAEAIESVLAQTMPPDEILVIDDCSVDGSEEVIRRYEDRVRFVRNDHNLGIVENFKKAVGLTTSTYIAFLGADNRLRSDYVERCKAILDRSQDVGVVYTDMLLFGSRAKLLADSIGVAQVGECIVERSPIYLWRFPEPTDEVLGNFDKLNFIHGSSMYRRQGYDEVGGYRATEGPEDHDLFKRMLHKGWLAKRCPYPLIEYRQHSASQDNTVLNIQLELNYWRSQSHALSQVLADRDGQIAILKPVVVERDTQIIGLNQVIAERDAQVVGLNQVTSERDRHIQTIGERDAQIVGFNQVIAERDRHIVGLNQLISVYENSNSWRVTKPLRLVGSQLRTIVARGNTINRSPGLLPAAASNREINRWSLSAFQTNLRSKLIRKARAFYRRWLKRTRIGRLIKDEIMRRGYITSAEIHISALTHESPLAPPFEEAEDPIISEAGVPGFHLSQPLNLTLSAQLSIHPHINVLIPGLRLKHMSGGPNTALLLAVHLVEIGESVRLIAIDASIEGEEAALYPHMESLFQRPIDWGRITVIDGFDRSKPIVIGANDLFLATAWWTAQIAKYAVQKTNYDKFIYLIQDFEPILHKGSTFQALALETYGLPHIPVINSRLLLDHLIREGCGCFSEQTFAENALFFEPAIDRSRYFPDVRKQEGSESRKRTLLFYARPTVAERNLFEIGIVALRRAVAAGVLDSATWEILAIGEKLDPVPLGNGMFLKPLPWLSFDDYAERIRTADLLLSLMLSPHPSYPPLEMAASGNLVVTNSFSVKTKERMQALSPNILVAAPTPDSIAATLENAVGRINARLPSPDPFGTIDLPATWNESLGNIVPMLKDRIDTVRRVPSQCIKVFSQGHPTIPMSDYEHFRKRRLRERRGEGQYSQEPGLLSFVTTVYDTDPRYLEELASSIFLQDGGAHFEWFVLDNGSSNEATRSTLQSIARHSCVRLERAEKNLGIIGGMRYCLERASGRYVLPLDSDDLIEPDCVHVLTRILHEAKYPALLYTDEDKLTDDRFVSPYFKPAWDPVLFVHSCYIAHLCAIDREKALLLNAYSDEGAEGCHDWDSFIRFMSAGYVPLHVPEVLYSWRMHSQSTAGNITSKSYISDSHRKTLQKFLDHAATPHIELIESPLFNYGVDWWLRRKRHNPIPYLSLVIGQESAALASANSQKIIFLNHSDGVNKLAEAIEKTSSGLVHICWDGIKPDNDEWLWEAMALSELFPDTVVMGGTLHDGNKVLSASRIFGFGGGFDCPDIGRPLSDSGYFAQMWKPHSVSAISSGHCVVRHDFLMGALGELLEEQVPLNMLGPWLGGLAREAGKRVVFSPFMSALAKAVPEDSVSQGSRAHFLSRFRHLLPEEELLSPRLGLNVAFAYTPVSDMERERHLKRLQHEALPYPDWLDLEIRRRIKRYPLPNKVAALSILTAVYEKSSIAFLDALADSITKQTLRPAQWLIVANGPILEEDLRSIRQKAQALWGATLVVDPQSLGIIGALRRGLELAQGEYIVPVDADDLLTNDAVQILVHEIDRLDQPDLIFSDEDLLIDEKPSAPYLRSAFDPVLNLDSSYIWHLCAIKLVTALKLDLYTDAGANWSQDWDSVTRIANAGGRIEHIAEILYHWRQHPGSTTNKSDGDPRSLDSMRNILEKQILRTTHPERYSVEPWPINRGAKELYIARRNVDLPRFVWIGDLGSGWLSDGASEDAILVATTGSITIEKDEVFNEVARLFELHPNVAAIGGRVVDKNGLVVDGCLVINRAAKMESPWMGHHTNHGSPYALALKPQSVVSTGASLAFFRIRALQAIGLSPPAHPSLISSWILATCERLISADWRVAYSPLVCARTTTPLRIACRPRHFYPTSVP